MVINPQLALALKSIVDANRPVSALPPGMAQSLIHTANTVTNPQAYQQMGNNRADQAHNQFAKSIQSPAPAPSSRVGWGDALGLGLGALIGKLFFHSTDNDLAQFGQAFMGAREQGAQRTDDQNMRKYQTDQELAKLNYQHEMGKANESQEFAKSLMGIKAKAAQDKTNFDQAKQLKQMDVDAKTTAATEKTRVDVFKAMWRDASEEGRRQLALQWSSDPGFAKAVSELNAQGRDTVSKTNERDALLSGKIQNQEDEHLLKSQKYEHLKVMNPKLAKKLDEDIKKVIAATNLDNRTAAKVAEQTRFIAPEFAVRYANVASQIAKREQDGLGGPSLSDIKRLRDLTKADLDSMVDPKNPLSSLGSMTPEQLAEAKQKMADFQKLDAQYRQMVEAGSGWGAGLPDPLEKVPARDTGLDKNWRPDGKPVKNQVKPMGGDLVPRPEAGKMRARYDELVKIASSGRAWTPAEKAEFIELTERLKDGGQPATKKKAVQQAKSRFGK